MGEYAQKHKSGDGTLGRLELKDGRIYLTDRSGTYRAIDAETGKSLGEIFRIIGTGTAASSALPLEKGRLLAPLTDGTVLLAIPKIKVDLPFVLVPIGPLGIPFVPVPLE